MTDPDWLIQARERGLIVGGTGVNTAILGHPQRPRLPPPPAPPEGCSERVFQDHARLLFLRSGFDLFYHTRKSRGSDGGFPDCVAGRGVGELVVAELKVGKAKPTAGQEKWLAFFRTIPGARVFVWKPKDWPEMVEALR